MRNKYILLIIAFSLTILFATGANGIVTENDRTPAVAGKFYPAEKSELLSMLDTYFSLPITAKNNGVVEGLIVPHAGYVFSGDVAASAYKLLDADKEYKHIFILAASHHVSFDGASIYNQGDYLTPLGKVPVDKKIANDLIKNNKHILFKKEAHQYEHSIEVQLPFLQYYLKKDFLIVPIVIGTLDLDVLKNLSNVLKPYFTDDNLFIISTDFSHYPAYNDAINADTKTGEALLSNTVENLINVIRNNADEGIQNLQTSMCGLAAALATLFITEDLSDISYNKIAYKNSGDTKFGNKQQVVGYYAMTITNNNNTSSFSLTDEEKKTLLSLARESIDKFLTDGSMQTLSANEYTEALTEKCGAFVTLNKNGNLRGCIGRLVGDKPLYSVIQKMAIAAATEDPRFPNVTKQELNDIDIEISVLTPLKKITSIDEIELGRHGILISDGFRSGTFLPQVADETGWTKEEFLGHCSRDKAGLGWDGWQSADVYSYEAIVFEEDDF